MMDVQRSDENPQTLKIRLRMDCHPEGLSLGWYRNACGSGNGPRNQGDLRRSNPASLSLKSGGIALLKKTVLDHLTRQGLPLERDPEDRTDVPLTACTSHFY